MKVNIWNLIKAMKELYLFWLTGITHWPLYISNNCFIVLFDSTPKFSKAIKTYQKNLKNESAFKTRNISFNCYLHLKKNKLSDSTLTSHSSPHLFKFPFSWQHRLFNPRQVLTPTFHHKVHHPLQTVGEVDESKNSRNKLFFLMKPSSRFGCSTNLSPIH